MSNRILIALFVLSLCVGIAYSTRSVTTDFPPRDEMPEAYNTVLHKPICNKCHMEIK